MKLFIYFVFISLFSFACSNQQVKKQTVTDDLQQQNSDHSKQSVSNHKASVNDSNNKFVKKSNVTNPKTIKPNVTKSAVIKISKKTQAKIIPIIKKPKLVKVISKPKKNETKKVETKIVIDKPVVAEQSLAMIQKDTAIPSIEKKVEQIGELENKAVNSKVFSEQLLPISYGSMWSLDRKIESLSKQTRCVLSSKTKAFFDGYSDAKMWLELSSSSLLIKTSSTVDLTYPGVGIYAGKRPPFLFDGLLSDSHVFNKKQIKSILKVFGTSSKATIKLGFWPTWPQTKTTAISFSLSGFDKAIKGLRACDRL